MPKAKWRKNSQQVDVSMEQTPEFCRLKLKAVKRGDSGEYELELKNEMGEDKVPITVKVIGKYRRLCMYMSSIWIMCAEFGVYFVF